MIYYVGFYDQKIFRAEPTEKKSVFSFSLLALREIFLIINHLNQRDSEVQVKQKKSEVQFRDIFLSR